MTEPVRRRIEQPTEDAAKRSGCLMWGAVLGVLVGIMVGVYALPPILRHYYGETKVAADASYEDDNGTQIRVESIGQASDPLGEVSLGMRRFDFFASVSLTLSNNRTLGADVFSLEFSELEDWQQASTIAEQATVSISEFTETSIVLHFIVEIPRDEADHLTPEALHLSDPRVRFAIAEQ